MTDFSIETSNLTKSFGNLAAIDNLNLKIGKGEIFAFLGPNGAGKTTTIKILTGLLQANRGSATIAGYDIKNESQKVKQMIGLISDQPFVYLYLTGFEFMRFVGDIYSVPIDEQKARIPELLEMFELKQWSNDLVESYSHGMKQKLVFASVLLHNPQVIFLDEPLVGLDPKGARIVKDIFLKLSERGVTIFMCTHVLEIAEKVAHRAGIIQQGKLIALENVEDLRKKINPKGNLEDSFLELTGGSKYGELLRYL